MKKISYNKVVKTTMFIGGAVLLLAGIVSTNGCKKDTNKLSEINANSDNLKASIVMTKEDSLFSKKIMWFDSIMNNYKTIPNYSLNKQFSIDSAIYYLETWFNAKYAFPDESFINVVHRDTAISVSLSQGLVSMDGIYNKITSVKSLTTDKYSGLGFSKKALILVHLKQLSTGSLNQLNFELQMTFGELGTKDHSYEPFGDDDAWKYGDELGKCHATGFEGTDAAELIQEEINTNRPLVSPPPGYTWTYGPNEDITVMGYEFDNPIDDTPYDNDLDKLIFYRTSEYTNLSPSTADGQCLEPYTMNFHYFGELDVINHWLPARENKPSNWAFMTCDLLGEQYPDGNNNVIIHHKSILTFALRYLVREDWIQEEGVYCTK
ncbi:MAG: hypothetical protein A2W85_13360 [Bacteroidetes bacterium GWF2_41_31]|nr:MAG: hypothetical protein A2W85_13360 [Bacteroidetes bacterium GWF2_41_31]OFZ03026.1 MAG: hypothetical protein A2338_04195 [Bacteroidetes bacterium RIFOXYB12_FULL_41_6]